MSVHPLFARDDGRRAVPTVRLATLSAKIVAEVREALFEKRLRPGDFLGSEKEIAARSGTSRIVARDALRTLQAFGIVEIRPGAGGGARITKGNPQLFAEAPDGPAQLADTPSGPARGQRRGGVSRRRSVGLPGRQPAHESTDRASPTRPVSTPRPARRGLVRILDSRCRTCSRKRSAAQTGAQQDRGRRRSAGPQARRLGVHRRRYGPNVYYFNNRKEMSDVAYQRRVTGTGSC